MKVTFRENGVACFRDVKNNEMIFRNCEGRKEQFNTGGARHFTLSLPDDVADILIEHGFNVKIKMPKVTGTNNADEVKPYKNLQVNLRYYGGPRDPKAYYMLENGGYQLLDEDTIKMLDTMTFESCDMDIYPKTYISSFTGEEGVSARLNNIRIIPQVDAFASEFGFTTPSVWEEDFKNKVENNKKTFNLESDDLPF